MDILDAGVYCAKWEARVPPLQTVLWGPLQAKEMGFSGWEWQDGGETGFITHRPHVKMPAGFATATLIVQNRTKRAYLTVYLGGYPADVPEAQRRLDQERLVGQAQAFLTRLAKQPVTLEFQGEVRLVDNVDDATLESARETDFLEAPADERARAGRRPAGAHRTAAETNHEAAEVWDV